MKGLEVAALALAMAMTVSACGAVYQAHTRLRGERMLGSLKAGESAVDIHSRWGQPDIVLDRGGEAEVWSYAERPNSDDLAASIFYSGVKEGDKGTFVDLQMVNGKLQSWSEAEHRMPAKRGADFGYTLGPSANTTHF